MSRDPDGIRATPPEERFMSAVLDVPAVATALAPELEGARAAAAEAGLPYAVSLPA